MPRVEGIHKFRGGETEADFHMFSLLGFQQVNYQEIRDSPTSPGAPGEAGRKPVLAPGDPLKHRLHLHNPRGCHSHQHLCELHSGVVPCPACAVLQGSLALGLVGMTTDLEALSFL